MFRKALLLALVALCMMALLPALTVAAQEEGPYFEFTDVQASCSPDEYVVVSFEYYVPEGYWEHRWSLTNLDTGSQATWDVGLEGEDGDYITDYALNELPVPGDTQPGHTLRLRVQTWWVGEGQELVDSDEVTWVCGGAVPGCDTLINLPSTAVVGQFVGTTPAYWSPGHLTNPIVTIDAGKTAWVLGLDKTGQYYKFLWVCQFLWAPVNTLGPNPDAVWNNTPLPSGVVE